MQKSFDKKKVGFGSELWDQLDSTNMLSGSPDTKHCVESFKDFKHNFARLNELYEKSITDILILKKEIDDLRAKH
ncbi:MAG: hypothetical protein L7U87_04210 [Chlamydiales bacterium]|nr:hypothetical protein [Chlamydiales bacterium]